MHNVAFKTAAIVTGAFIMGIAVRCIYEPSGLVTGGISGIGIILKETAGIPVWLCSLVLNIPLFFIALRMLGVRKLLWSVVGMISFVTVVGVMPEIDFFKGDFFLAGICGGALTGVGTGLIIRENATTGGVDLAAYLVNIKKRRLKTAWLIFAADAVIICAGIPVFSLNRGIYAVISVFVAGCVSDRIIEGPGRTKVLFIISRNEKEAAAFLMNEMERGVTGLESEGMYSGRKGHMLMCAVSERELPYIRKKLREIDSDSFILICSVTEVLGEGFVKN